MKDTVLKPLWRKSGETQILKCLPVIHRPHLKPNLNTTQNKQSMRYTGGNLRRESWFGAHTFRTTRYIEDILANSAR